MNPLATRTQTSLLDDTILTMWDKVASERLDMYDKWASQYLASGSRTHAHGGDVITMRNGSTLHVGDDRTHRLRGASYPLGSYPYRSMPIRLTTDPDFNPERVDRLLEAVNLATTVRNPCMPPMELLNAFLHGVGATPSTHVPVAHAAPDLSVSTKGKEDGMVQESRNVPCRHTLTKVVNGFHVVDSLGQERVFDGLAKLTRYLNTLYSTPKKKRK